MQRALPAIYLSLLFVEALVLVPAYLVLQPASGSLTNAIVGTVGVLCMIAMLVYSVARRSRTLRSMMRLSLWLHLHIFLGLQGILLVYLHCLPLLWRHGPPMLLNPGMLNLYALTVVFASGLFGRYLYAQVPKTLGGQHLAAKDLDAELETLREPVPEEVRALWQGAPSGRGFLSVIAAGRARRRALKALRRMVLDPQLAALAERRITLERQKAVLGSAQGVFWLWIVLHRPVALAMYLITFVHVVLGILYTPSLQIF